MALCQRAVFFFKGHNLVTFSSLPQLSLKQACVAIAISKLVDSGFLLFHHLFSCQQFQNVHHNLMLSPCWTCSDISHVYLFKLLSAALQEFYARTQIHLSPIAVENIVRTPTRPTLDPTSLLLQYCPMCFV